MLISFITGMPIKEYEKPDVIDNKLEFKEEQALVFDGLTGYLRKILQNLRIPVQLRCGEDLNGEFAKVDRLDILPILLTKRLQQMSISKSE
ncbi:Hypothetical protein CINCED_3A020122 [Cinara cedri]|uniref:Uncharacterized protein n=1 Tax=Cinara cedri TaxID=506608 RepID=A0A5E4N250_9HEMI|nr:Hypothetical protein CINCED_3A020122 [Cinara cedri]